MKRFTFFTGLAILTTAITIPLLIRLKGTHAGGKDVEDNVRYDIDDYMASEGL
jgi:hypothetical protein